MYVLPFDHLWNVLILPLNTQLVFALRITEQLRLETTSEGHVAHAPAQGSPRAGYKEPYTDNSRISPRMESPQPLWIACASSPSQEKSIFWYSDRASCLAVCAHCLLPCHWALLETAWLCLLYGCFQLFLHIQLFVHIMSTSLSSKDKPSSTLSTLFTAVVAAGSPADLL